MIKKLRQFLCIHTIVWQWYYGKDEGKAFYDDWEVGTCSKCGKEFESD